MGAVSFEQYAFGRTPTKAYNKAVGEAEHEFGHDSYNGSISTTHGCNVVVQPAGMKLNDFVAMANALSDTDLGTDILWREISKPPRLRRGASENERLIHHVQWQMADRWKRLPEEVKDTIRLAARFEKWGCCTCVELTGTAKDRLKRDWKAERSDKAYLFFGLAAC